MRTDALDRKASTVAAFASLIATLTATLGLRFVERFDTGGHSPSSLQSREANGRKAVWVQWSFVLLLLGLVLIATEAATLGIMMVSE